MNYVDLGLRWMHILAAITMVGGTVFLRFVWCPATADLDAEEREQRFGRMRGSWAILVMLSSMFLLVSGLINALNNIHRYDLDSRYHMLVGIKLLLGLAFFFLSARIAGRSASAVNMRRGLRKWLSINTVLAVLLVAVAGYMKFVPRPLKSTTALPRAGVYASTDGAPRPAPQSAGSYLTVSIEEKPIH